MLNTPLKTKLSIYYGLLTGIIVAMLFSFFCIYNYRLITKNNRISIQTEADNTASKLEFMLHEMDALSTQVVFSSDLQDIFQDSLTAPDDQNYFDYHMEEASRARNILVSINSPKVLARRISVYNSSKNFITVGTVGYDVSRIEQGITDPFWTEEAVKADGKAVITPPVPDPWLEAKNSESVVILSRCFFSTYKGYNYLGMIEIQQSFRTLEEICASSNPASEILVFDQDQNIIYRSGNLQDRFIPQFLTLKPRQPGSSDGTPPGTILQKYIAYAPVKNYQWTVAVAQNQHDNSFFHNFLISLLWLSLCLIAVTFLVIRKLSAKIAQPLSDLTKAIEQVTREYKVGSEITLMPSMDKEETQRLNQSFEVMLRRIDQSVATEIQARTSEFHAQYFALTAQMNPHFLFNTLTLINSEAYEHKVWAITDICGKLCEMLRYTGAFVDSPMAGLQDEIHHAENYLELYHSRYDENFRYAIHAPAQLSGIQVPRMILQPLIENCFKHGFADKRPPWEIKINIELTQERWEIRISDNGTGFDEASRKSIFDKTEAYYEMMIQEGQKWDLEIGGLSIINIYARLKLLYQDSFHFEILDNKQGGADILLSAPIQKGIEKDDC